MLRGFSLDIGAKLALAASIILLWVMAGTSSLAAGLPVSGVRIVATFPHDATAYTEGLLFHDGYLFESTGLVGRSDVRKVRLSDGAVLLSRAINPNLFGEGIVNWRSEIISLTWRDQVGFRWDPVCHWAPECHPKAVRLRYSIRRRQWHWRWHCRHNY